MALNWWDSPYINHFVQPDTIIPEQHNPQNLNRYSYVLNNPLKYTDPTGHMQVSDDYKSSDGRCRKGDASCNWVGKEKKHMNTPNQHKENKRSQPITEAILKMPLSSGFYASLSKTLDGIALGLDIYSAGVVTYGGIGGTGIGLPFAEGGPEVPAVSGLAGMAIAELYVQPTLTLANIFATGGTAAAIVADVKAGNTRFEEGKVSTSVTNSITLTAWGWGNKEAYLSLFLQARAVSNAFGLTSFPNP